MDLKIRTETFGNEDQSWLASEHGTDSTRSVTIDYSKLGSAVSDKTLKSGTPLGRISASKLYGLFDPDATDGRQVLAGFLFTTQKVDGANVVAPLLEHGKVWAAKCPNLDSGDVASAQSDVNGRIIFADQAPLAGDPDDDASSSSGGV